MKTSSIFLSISLLIGFYSKTTLSMLKYPIRSLNANVASKKSSNDTPKKFFSTPKKATTIVALSGATAWAYNKIKEKNNEQAACQLSPTECAATCRLLDGSTIGPKHNDIERSGVLLLVPTKSPVSKHPFDQWGIVIGHDQNINLWMVGQAGKRDRTDISTAQTASRELLEETGGYVKLSADDISQLPYIYAGRKQLFAYKTTSTTLATDIKQSVKAAQKNPHLDHSFKEIDDIAIVSVNNFLKLAEKIDQNWLTQRQYTVTAQDGRTIILEAFYAQMFGHLYDHTRYQNAQLFFQSLCK
ncbi:MAG TPA: hypothetical protein VLG50_01745 [Candidatus Saccharimonadales bacterium]|nr:hypothetical protein [Candidatus Saccharimonadales bacterium]